MFARPDRALRWDVLALHLSEAAYLWTERQDGLASHGYTLSDVEEGPERRLLAHVDALTVGGRRVRDRLLGPALTSDDAEEQAAAAFALTFPGEGKDVALVAWAAAEAGPEVRPPLLQALALSPAPEAGPALDALLSSKDPALVAGALDALAFRRAVPPAKIGKLLSHADPRVLAAALRALRHVGGGAQTGAVRAALWAEEPELRLAALVTGVIGGVREAFDLARRERASPGAVGAVARVLTAALGGEDDARALAALTSDPDLRRDALFALGFSGRPLAVDTAVRWLGHADVAGVAAEAISAITGLAVTGPLARAAEPAAQAAAEEELPPLDQDLRASLLPGVDDELPHADPRAMAARWEELRPGFPADRRFLRGQPFDLGPLLSELALGPARRRPVLALELAARSKGAVQPEALALTSVQRAQLDSARALRGGPAFTGPAFPAA